MYRKSGCAISSRFRIDCRAVLMTYDDNCPSGPLNSIEGMILAPRSGLSRLHSLIREVFVLDSHHGRMANGDLNSDPGSRNPVKNYSKEPFRRWLRVNFCRRAAGTPSSVPLLPKPQHHREDQRPCGPKGLRARILASGTGRS